MSTFKDREQFESVMARLFERLMDAPTVAAPLRATDMVVRFRYPDLDSTLTFDFHAAPPEFSTSRNDPADVEMIQTTDTAHEFWSGRLNPARAIATGRVRARGDVARALKLLPAIRPAFGMYPQVLNDMGLEDRHERSAPHSSRLVKDLRGLLRRVGEDSLFQDLRMRLRGRRMNYDLLVEDLPLPRHDEPAATHDESSSVPAELAEVRREMLRRMRLIRCFEETLARQWEAGSLPTAAIHLSTGQEATAVGVCFALRRDDVIATTHRGHGHMLAKGAPASRMMAEIFGKATGLCSGKGGSMHVTDASVGAIGANGIVGASPILAAGAALSFQQRGEHRVAVAFLGDGATNQGMFHEALNLASTWRLPVLFVIENNGYGEFTPVRGSTNIDELSTRAAAYGIEGRRVDGNDVEAVATAARELSERARMGEGPALLECTTYRWRGHMEGDATPYRTAAELAAWKERDPCAAYEAELIDEGALSPHGARQLETEAQQVVDAAVTFAEESPDPAPEAALSHVYSAEPKPAPMTEDAGERRMTASEAINLALREEMERDDAVLLLGEDVALGGYFAVTKGLVELFGRRRVRDTPISENAIVGGAVGAAMSGLRPVAEILFSDFLTVCADPLVNQAAKLRYMSGGQYRVPLVVRTPSGAGLGMAAQHSQCLEATFMNVPGLIVASPGTPRDCRALLKAAIRSDNPVLFFEHKMLYLAEGAVPEAEEVAALGRARIVRRGGDVTLVALSYMVQVALEAAEALSKVGIDVEVVDPCTVAPLDARTILESVEKTRRLVTLEESPLRGGFGAEVVARIAAAAHGALERAPLRIGALDVPIAYAKGLETLSIPDVDRVTREIRGWA